MEEVRNIYAAKYVGVVVTVALLSVGALLYTSSVVELAWEWGDDTAGITSNNWFDDVPYMGILRTAGAWAAYWLAILICDIILLFIFAPRERLASS